MTESQESRDERLPEDVDEARIKGGTAVCRDCEFTVRFDGDESYDEAREKWHSDEHRDQHFDDGLRADGSGKPDKEQFEVETELSITGSIAVEAENADAALAAVMALDRDELLARLTSSEVRTEGVYRID